jgi:hypothetical protein
MPMPLVWASAMLTAAYEATVAARFTFSSVTVSIFAHITIDTWIIVTS